MEAVQLGFDLIGKPDIDIENYCLQQQINELKASMGKIQRKLFAEVGELKKLCTKQGQELQSLKEKRVEYTYDQDGYLFDIKAV